MKILRFKELRDTECRHECSYGVYLVIVCDLLMLYPVSNFKAIGQLVMEILHFVDLGDTVSVVTNAVVLVLGECQISMATYLRGYLPSYKVVLQCIGN